MVVCNFNEQLGRYFVQDVRRYGGGRVFQSGRVLVFIERSSCQVCGCRDYDGTKKDDAALADQIRMAGHTEQLSDDGNFEVGIDRLPGCLSPRQRSVERGELEELQRQHRLTERRDC